MKFRVLRSVPDPALRSAATLPGTLTARRRQWLIPVAVLAVTGSLLVAPAAPVVGLEGVPDHRPRLSACLGPALEPAGFVDTAGSFAEEAADCLAHYGITLGTDPEQGLFSPREPATRRQMALFLMRAAHPAGLDLPEVSDQGFTDLDVGSASRDAINQLVELGIMEGTSATTFDPRSPVTRERAALWLARFLSKAPTGPGGTDIDEVKPDDNHFTDVSNVHFKTRAAIRKIYEMGVTKGTSAFTFSPAKEVTRGQMAVFISRMLAHTHARPAGLIIQATEPALSGDSDVTVSISYRHDDHQPRSGQPVDVFFSTNPDEAFDDSGRCTGHVSTASRLGRICVVDHSDPRTSPAGFLRVDLDIADDAGALRVWAWAGHPGSVYFDRKGGEVVDIRAQRIPAALEVSDGMPATAQKRRLGDMVTFTFRLVDADGDRVAKPGVKFSLGVERWVNEHSFEYQTIIKETGPDGTFELSFRHTDQDTKELGDTAQLDLDVLDSGTLEVRDLTTVGLLADDATGQDRLLDWSDEESVVTSLTLTMPEMYAVASAEGIGAGNRVRAKLTDQYGSGAGRDHVIKFTSADPSVRPNNSDRNTDALGIATFSYRRDSDSGTIETMTARSGDLEATTHQYWPAPHHPLNLRLRTRPTTPRTLGSGRAPPTAARPGPCARD